MAISNSNHSLPPVMVHPQVGFSNLPSIFGVSIWGTQNKKEDIHVDHEDRKARKCDAWNFPAIEHGVYWHIDIAVALIGQGSCPVAARGRNAREIQQLDTKNWSICWRWLLCRKIYHLGNRPSFFRGVIPTWHVQVGHVHRVMMKHMYALIWIPYQSHISIGIYHDCLYLQTLFTHIHTHRIISVYLMCYQISCIEPWKPH